MLFNICSSWKFHLLIGLPGAQYIPVIMHKGTQYIPVIMHKGTQYIPVIMHKGTQLAPDVALH